MMKKYFNVNFQFDKSVLENTIISNLKNSKGYCCFVDANSLAFSYKNEEFRNILNNSLLNFCDGSYIAMFASKLHNTKLKEYTGPDFFNKFIYNKNSHLIIGNTERVFEKIKQKVKLKNKNSENIHYLNIPFKDVNEFNYKRIAHSINELSPEYIWISLGAPKQEIFMSKLIPHINSGIMLGIGAATNYFSDEIKDIPLWIKKMRLIWIYRLFTEPRKQIVRLKSIFFIFPKMILEEKRKLKLIK